MARPVKTRCICGEIKEYTMKPYGLSRRPCGNITLKAEEVEAMRLADFECMHQEEAAKLMKVSRQTFARIVESGRKKAIEAIFKGAALEIKCCGNIKMEKAGRRKK